MLAAGTARPSPTLMRTGTSWSAAALTNSAAGRACSPVREATFTVRSDMLAPSSGFDGDLDRGTSGHDVDALEHVGQRQAVRDQILHGDRAGGDELESASV